MSKIKKIEICCPVYNEEENIEDFFAAYTKVTRLIKVSIFLVFYFQITAVQIIALILLKLLQVIIIMYQELDTREISVL